jgi:hypothetical protein
MGSSIALDQHKTKMVLYSIHTFLRDWSSHGLVRDAMVLTEAAYRARVIITIRRFTCSELPHHYIGRFNLKIVSFNIDSLSIHLVYLQVYTLAIPQWTKSETWVTFYDCYDSTDRVLQKLNKLREEADQAVARAETAEAKNKEYEQLFLQKEQEISSLTQRLAVTDASFEKAETKLVEMKIAATEGEQSKTTNEGLVRKIELLEEELDAAEKNVKDTVEKYVLTGYYNRARLMTGCCAD